MIRIIKEGVKPKKYKYIYFHICTSCACEFEFEESDCTEVRHEKRIDGEHVGEINCPFCGERLFIDFKTLKPREEEITEDSTRPTTIYMDDLYDWTPSLCKCPNCGSSDTLVSGPFKLTMLLPQYNFKCEECGHRWTGPKQASINTKLYNPWDNEHCNKCRHKDVGDTCYCCPYWPYKVTCNTEVKK